MLASIAQSLTRWSTRWVPDAFVIAILLTCIAACLILATTAANPLQLIQYWGDGYWTLLSFSMQMCIVMMAGYIVAVSQPVKRLLEKMVLFANTGRGAVTLTAFIALILCSINWGMGLITSAIFVRTMAKSAAKRGIRVDYRLLVASAYLGMATTWHAGLSGSATLLMATPKHFLEKEFGLISTSQTIFHPFNITLLLIVILVMGFLAWKLHPHAADTVSADAALIKDDEQDFSEQQPLTPAERIERSQAISLILGSLGFIWLIRYFITHGLELTLDVVNLTFLTLGVLLHRTPRAFLKAAQSSGAFIWGMVIQFPLYGGIFGMVKFSGFQDVLAGVITNVATSQTFPLFSYWYSGLLNYIVPSGGSKWAIEAPYLLQAGNQLGVPSGITVLSYAWGDMMTDAIQPFWAIPLLGITKLGFRDIMGFLIIFFVVYATIVSAAFALLPWLVGW